MNDKLLQQLHSDFPDLCSRAKDNDFDVGDGWYTIIHVLCSKISYDVENAKRRLKYSLENPESKMKETIAELEANVAAALENLPVIVRVKEKLGGLRIYVDNANEEIFNYISFAESMSYHICEECGNNGQLRNNGWVKVLCDRHHTEKEAEDFFPRMKKNFDRMKLSDEI